MSMHIIVDSKRMWLFLLPHQTVERFLVEVMIA